VRFQSSDGKLFHIRRKYLEHTTGAFPGPEFDTHGEVTHLTESAAVLELLFRFAYPAKQPELDGMGFAVVSTLAEAAEKYEVYSAMNVCRMRLR